VAIITGAGQGIGAETARLFAREGASVLVTDINADTAERTAGEIRAAGGTAAHARVDVAAEAEAAALARLAEDHLGPPTVLVNNAGIAVFDDPVNLTARDWQRCMAVDLEGVWTCTQSVLPGMLERAAGAVVNIASVHSFQIIRGCFPYPVAKHGVIGLTRALAVEYADRGLRFNAICPAYIDTQINRDQFDSTPDPAATRRAVEKLHPVGRLGTVEDVAYAALFLASREAAFVTGASLMVDGGRSLVFHD
jgi:NAD(P)-dependent dehydrogenase (short-subunit alcohol dehydrogenase family)